MGKGLGKLFDAFRSAGVAADAATLATMGVTVAGGAVASPVLLCGAVAIAGLAGWSVYRDWKTGEKIDKIASIEGWLQDTARRHGRESASLEQVLMYARNPQSDARDALPGGLKDDHLARLLAIIQAQGEDREKLLREHNTMVESLSGFVSEQFEHLQERLDLHQADLTSIRRDARKAASGTDFLEWLLLDRESPPLHLPNTVLEESTRFIYSARRVRMRGREHEMDELASFLDAEEKFSWAAWTALAGMGKSRLALEFCDRAAESGWEVGFYDWDVSRTPSWDTWQPTLPTLIVFDYVQEYADDISKAIGHLASQSNGLARKVRFLLLERPAPESSAMAAGSWWQTLLDSTHEHRSNAIAASCYYHELNAPKITPRPRLLEGIDQESVKEILSEIAQIDGQSPDDAELGRQLAQLEAVSADRRPLYVALAAEAISEGAMQPSWDAQDLTSYVLSKERGRWGKALQAAGVPANEHQKWINLSLLATMCGGLTIRIDGPCIFEDEGLVRWVPRIEDHGDGSTLASFTPGATGETLPKLEPDMLGELFVLEEFGRIPHRDRSMLTAAWRHDSEGFLEFLLRAVNSFPQHERLEHLLWTPDDTADIPGWNPKILFFVKALRIDRLRELADTTRAIAFENELLTLLQPYVREYRQDSEARRWLGIALYNAFNDSEPNSKRADGFLGELRILSKSHSEDASVREQLAQGLFNAFNDSEPNSKRARNLLAELRKLSETYPEETTVRESFAGGLRNTIADCGSYFRHADSLLSELRDICDAYPEDDDVRQQLAHAYGASLHNATLARNAARAADMAQALVPLADVLRALPEKVPVFLRVFMAAIDLAIELDDGESGTRLINASRAIFGDENDEDP